MDNFLTRDQIDSILDAMTARDIFAAIPGTKDAREVLKGGEIAGQAFESAAERQGHGALTLDRVRPADAIYLAQRLGEVFASDSPKDGATEDLPDSSGIGESTPS